MRRIYVCAAIVGLLGLSDNASAKDIFVNGKKVGNNTPQLRDNHGPRSNIIMGGEHGVFFDSKTGKLYRKDNLPRVTTGPNGKVHGGTGGFIPNHVLDKIKQNQQKLGKVVRPPIMGGEHGVFFDSKTGKLYRKDNRPRVTTGPSGRVYGGTGGFIPNHVLHKIHRSK